LELPLLLVVVKAILIVEKVDWGVKDDKGQDIEIECQRCCPETVLVEAYSLGE
jgi:hypothetical protein